MPNKHNNTIGITLTERRQRVLAVSALLGLQTSLTACGGDPEAGRILFEGQCQKRHLRGATALKTPAAKVPALLQSGAIRLHRFHLDDTQLRDLEACLTGVKAGGG